MFRKVSYIFIILSDVTWNLLQPKIPASETHLSHLCTSLQFYINSRCKEIQSWKKVHGTLHASLIIKFKHVFEMWITAICAISKGSWNLKYCFSLSHSPSVDVAKYSWIHANTCIFLTLYRGVMFQNFFHGL